MPRGSRSKRARIKRSIASATFSFAEEFPDFRHLEQVPSEGSPRTCNEVFDAFLADCQSRLEKDDLASVTVATYRLVLNGAWRPLIGGARFLSVQYSTLVEVADRARWSKKTYNNALGVLRRAFKFGYRDHPAKDDPTVGLRSVRMRKKDRPVIDPLTIQDAERLIAAIHGDWGEAQLGPDGRAKPAVGREATRSQHHDDAARVCRVGRRDGGDRPRCDQTRHGESPDGESPESVGGRGATTAICQ